MQVLPFAPGVPDEQPDGAAAWPMPAAEFRNNRASPLRTQRRDFPSR